MMHKLFLGFRYNVKIWLIVLPAAPVAVVSVIVVGCECLPVGRSKTKTPFETCCESSKLFASHNYTSSCSGSDVRVVCCWLRTFPFRGTRTKTGGCSVETCGSG